jgi:uncharacterized SAM-binding protein YcdF (DUF218 family)
MSESGAEIPQVTQREGGSKDAPKTAEKAKPSLDAILIFGQGPVVEKDTRQKASEVAEKGATEDINLWSKALAQAAAELYKRGQTREFIVMGGQTGGKDFASEAELITKEMESFGVSANAIKIENRSTNTLENLTNVLNDYLDKDRQEKSLGILTANYHLSRTRMLMGKFGIPYKTAFSAEEVLRYVAREGENWDNEKLLEIEKKLNMGEASKVPVSAKDKVDIYFQSKQGTEKKNIVRRGQEDDFWSKALLEVPEYWMGYVGRLQSGERIRQILSNQDQNMLAEKFNIHVTSDTDEVIKQKLLAITRKLPDLEKGIGQDWPEETKAKLEAVTAQKQV